MLMKKERTNWLVHSWRCWSRFSAHVQTGPGANPHGYSRG